ncbi:MAG: AI-2E family transporter [Candidatus Kerfeldbacteria bacterium]|nr:AI-2E family transporter [Candidatus Kerfeldbacteria bacterium]
MPQDTSLRNINVSFVVLLKIVLMILALYFLYQVLDVLALVFVAIVLSTALDPWVDWFQRNHVPRSLAMLIIYFVLFVVISLVVVLMVPPLVAQLGQLASSFPYYYSKLAAGFSSWETGAGDDISATLQQTLQSLGSSLANATSSVLSTVAGIFGGLVQFVVALVMTYYLVVDETGLKRFIRSLTPSRHQDYVWDLMSRIQRKLGLWLRGQLLLMLVVGVMTYIGLAILKAFNLVQMDYILVLALWAALTEVVPYIGPVLGGIPAVFLALAVSPIQALIVLGLYVLVQQLENNLLVPVIMKRAVGLNPIVSIVVILIGAKLGGIVGALICIPVATALAVVLSDVFDQHLTQQLDRPGGDETLTTDV